MAEVKEDNPDDTWASHSIEVSRHAAEYMHSSSNRTRLFDGCDNAGSTPEHQIVAEPS